MKLIIAGPREVHSRGVIEDAIRGALPDGVTEIVHGAARGVDSIADDMFDGIFPVKPFPADWNTHGKGAGPIRNRQMAEYADALLLVWYNDSPGSRNMKKTMEKMGKPVIEVVMKHEVK